jgi:hypothetical protein
VADIVAKNGMLGGKMVVNTIVWFSGWGGSVPFTVAGNPDVIKSRDTQVRKARRGFTLYLFNLRPFALKLIKTSAIHQFVANLYHGFRKETDCGGFKNKIINSPATS